MLEKIWSLRDSGDVEESVGELLSALYELDPALLPNVVSNMLRQETGETEAGLVWFDLMSPLAGIHRERLHKFIGKHHPDMPVVALLQNAGKWETAPEEVREFASKKEFVSNDTPCFLTKSLISS